MILNDRINGIKKLRQSLTCLCRDKQHLCIWHKCQLLSDILGKLVHGLVIFLDGIPLVHCNDHTLAALMGNTCDLGILFCHTFLGINHQNHHIGTLHRRNRTDNTITFNILLDLALTAQTCCIDENIFLAVVLDHRIDGITCCTGNIADNNTILTCQFVDQG